MNKTIQKAISTLVRCGSYVYVGDCRTGLYHSFDCPNISSSDLRGCGRHPENSGFWPCPYCLPELAAKTKKVRAVLPKPRKEYIINQNTQQSYTKANVVKSSLTQIAMKYNFYIEFVGNTAFVTTVVGEWYFDYSCRPITLHHMNTQPCFSNGYYSHRQNKSFSSPAHVLSYIRAHENATVKRLMDGEQDKTEIM